MRVVTISRQVLSVSNPYSDKKNYSCIIATTLTLPITFVPRVAVLVTMSLRGFNSTECFKLYRERKSNQDLKYFKKQVHNFSSKRTLS